MMKSWAFWLQFYKLHILTWGLWKYETCAQSICTHYSSLSGWPDIFLGSGTLKKVQNMGCKKQGAKKQGHCYSKREEADRVTN